MNDRTYLSALQRLLPLGWAWTRSSNANLTRLLHAFASTLSRLHSRALDLQEGASPLTATETLLDWERLLDLPGKCGDVPESIQERRDAIASRLTSTGGQSVAVFEGIARQFDTRAVVREFRPAICGFARCGDQLNGSHSSRHHWQIQFSSLSVRFARAGGARCGDKLSEFNEQTLAECLIRMAAPAHTYLTFSYTR